MRDPGVTALLKEMSAGRTEALADLMPLVYAELQSLARRHLQRERADHTLSPTALVHEAYLRLVEVQQVDWRDRAHFFAMASRSMRRVLIDHARSRGRQKRGGSAQQVELHEAIAVSPADAEELIALDQALTGLEQIAERACRVVECRVFAGLSVDETAVALGTSPATVKRDWAFARAWLNEALGRGRSPTVE